jgi:hypothetical protein
MSHFLTIPINEHGLIHHQRFEEQLQTTGTDLFGLTDVFLYSHGWWPGGSGAQAEQNALALGLAKSLQGHLCASPSQWPKIGAAFAPLALPIHWPAPQPEEQDRVGLFRRATSFTSLQQRADSVGRHAGYSLLRLMIERQKDGQPYRFNLIGHSFGCRVLCSALQALAEDDAVLARLAGNEFNVVLLQPVMDCDALEPGQPYGKIQQGIPKLRMLITTSTRDLALSEGESMGARGPTGDLVVPVVQRFDVTDEVVPTFTERLGVADLTALHLATSNDRDATDGWSGQHSDINHPQIFDLLARFFGQ